MRSKLRQLLLRFGLTGKLLFLFGLVLALSIGLLVALTHARARATIREELRRAELVRLQRWVAKHHRILEADDRWQLAKEVEEILLDPYVVYAGIFDRMGQPVAQTGNREAYLEHHALTVRVRLLRGFPGEGRHFEEVTPPLPGVAVGGDAESEPASVDEPFRVVLDAAGLAEEDHLGFIEVTLSMRPLDSLVGKVLRPLYILAAAFFAGGLLLVWVLLRRVTTPLRMLREKVDLIAQGNLDVPFDTVPRPLDEVGDLATHISVMAGQVRRARERLAEDLGGRVSRRCGGDGPLDKTVHDLKNPITSIVAFAEILKDSDSIGEAERRRYLEMIGSEGRRLAGILDSLPAGGTEVAPEPAVPGPPAAGRRRVLVALGDPELRSLLREAIQKDGYEVTDFSDAITALRSAREEKPHAVLLDLLFEGGEGVRALDALERTSPSGGIRVIPLGLTGHEGRYAAGRLYLHAKPVDREALLGSIREASAAGRMIHRILVVDDDRFVAEGIRAILEREGFRVETAAGGEQALKAAEARPPDLVIADLTMPGTDGVQVVRRLRERPETRATPVILTSGHDLPRRSALSWQEALIERETLIEGILSALRGAIG